MQVDVDVTCIRTNFGGRGLSRFGDIGTFKNDQFSLSDHGLYYSPWSSKKFNSLESAQKNRASRC